MPFAFVSSLALPSTTTTSSLLLHHRHHNAVHSLRRRSLPRSHIQMSSTQPQSQSQPQPEPQPEPQPPTPPLSPLFTRTRATTFLLMSATYTLYVLLRSTFTYISPALSTTLSLPLSSIGQISSFFPLLYGLSRLLTGPLVDRHPPHLALSLGLCLAGLVNIAMGTASSVGALSMLWALNGLVQGVGAGASAKLITSWFSAKERGVYWALWSTSANVGGVLAPVVCATLATNYGFRAGLLVPGIAAVVLAAVAVPFMKSSPEQAGLIAPWKQQKGKELEKEQFTWKQAFVKGVVKNRTIWLLAISYFFVYLIRAGLKSWLHFWLIQTKALTIAEATYRISGMELGGILGTFSAGIISDRFNSRRIAVTIVYLLGLLASLYGIWVLNVPASWHFLLISVAGFMINGPQMMIGLVGAEVSDARVVATATGVLGCISYLGAAAAGYPLSLIIGAGWGGFWRTLLASTAVAAACLVPLWKLQGEK